MLCLFDILLLSKYFCIFEMHKNNKILKRTVNSIFNTTILLILLFFSTTNTFFAQDVPKIIVTVKLKILDGDLKNSQITITKKGAPYKVIDPSNGDYDVDLPLGFEYVFTFTKVGYVTKSLIVDTHVPEHREDREFAKQISETQLEKQTGKLEDRYVHFTGKITYSIVKGDFDFGKVSSTKTEKILKNENEIPVVKPKKNPVVVTDNKPVNKQTKLPITPTLKNRNERVIQEDYRRLTIITIIIDEKEYVYTKEEYNWGGTYYYKDGKGIIESTFKKETE